MLEHDLWDVIFNWVALKPIFSHFLSLYCNVLTFAKWYSLFIWLFQGVLTFKGSSCLKKNANMLCHKLLGWKHVFYMKTWFLVCFLEPHSLKNNHFCIVDGVFCFSYPEPVIAYSHDLKKHKSHSGEPLEYFCWSELTRCWMLNLHCHV